VFYRRNVAWDQVTATHSDKHTVRAAVQKGTMERLTSPFDGSASRARERPETRDAKVLVVLTDASLESVLEATSLMWGLCSSPRIQASLVSELSDAFSGTDILPEGVLVQTASEAKSAADDWILPVGESDRTSLPGRWIEPLSGESHASTAAWRATHHPLRLGADARAPVLELPVNLPPSLRNDDEAAIHRFDALREGFNLLTAVRVRAETLDEVFEDALNRGRCGRVVFVDCDRSRVRVPGDESRAVAVRDIHALQQAADVWVDWDLRPAARAMDHWLAQAMLEDCIAVSANLSSDDLAVQSGAVQVVSVRDWEVLTRFLIVACRDSTRGERHKLESKCFAVTSFSDRAIAARVARWPWLTERPARAPARARAPSFVVPRLGRSRGEPLDVPRLRRMLSQRRG
jgi:hypothetical protein